MLELKSILTHISKGISNKDLRFLVPDDEHVTDIKTGITLHVYDNWFKITYDGNIVITKDDFTVDEQSIVWQIKQLITSPEVLKQREVDYKPLQVARRDRLSKLYEKPKPLVNTAPVVEQDTTQYTG